MKKTVTLSDFIAGFRAKGRGNQFSRDALETLFNYYEDLERDTGRSSNLM